MGFVGTRRRSTLSARRSWSTSLSTASSRFRSWLRNRELAVERLVEQLRRALKVERRRVPTKPTEASRRRRLDEKQRRSRTKRLRRDLDD